MQFPVRHTHSELSLLEAKKSFQKSVLVWRPSVQLILVTGTLALISVGAVSRGAFSNSSEQAQGWEHTVLPTQVSFLFPLFLLEEFSILFFKPQDFRPSDFSIQVQEPYVAKEN